jgi:translation initiation factor IF-3
VQIRSKQLQNQFQSKIQKLTDGLEYLDRVGIKATISIEGRELSRNLRTDKVLETVVEVSCEDEGFKAVLEKMVERFNHHRKHFTTIPLTDKPVILKSSEKHTG